MRPFLTLIFSISFLVLLLPASAPAIVEIGRVGQDPVIIEEVYQREGTSFVAIDDVLSALQMEGEWVSIDHIYRIRTSQGWAVISPGSQFLKLGDSFVPISHRPRFIDGKLRVAETFILGQLAPLMDEPLRYRNHNPPALVEPEDPLDRLFAFLLRRKPQPEDRSHWLVALDPGHGGLDSGAIGPDGSKEKDVNLAVARRIERFLKMHQAAPVIMTRDDDYEVAVEKRLQSVAQAGADVLLSLHGQNFFSPDAHGVMLFVQAEMERDLLEGLTGENASRQLAEALQAALESAGFTVAGIFEQPVLPLGRGDLPRVLVEMGSLSNPDDLAMLHDLSRQQDLARALFDGLQKFFKTDKDAEDELAIEQAR
jgi:N-acetylmuramoyl-L-alanine amidase